MTTPVVHSSCAINWSRLLALCSFLLVLIGALRIVFTYNVFNETFDEPAHIACGMQWLQTGRYDYELQHPPLARVAAALGPYLAGVRTSGDPNKWTEGRAVLYSGNAQDRNLFLARLGILPFYLVACWVVWSWTRRLFGSQAALLATVLFTSLPPILAHAGLATTDMALAAFVPAALYAFTLWLERPNAARTVLLGSAVGLAVLSKFSSLIFLPPAGAAILGLRLFDKRAQWVEGLWTRACCAFAVAFLVIWAGYRFSVVPLNSDPHVTKNLRFLEKASKTQQVLAQKLMSVPLPAAQVAIGLADILHHNSSGHFAYLLGRTSKAGWWYFFPIVLGVKTPIGFLLLLGFGAALLGMRSGKTSDPQVWAPAACASAILLACMLGRINLGVRHILPIYGPLAVVAGFGAHRLIEVGTRPGSRSRAVALALAVGLLLWHSASSALAHPDYLAYFNETAGAEPERILADSDLDWGQDLKRLSAKLREMGIRQVAIACQGTADVTRLGLPSFTYLDLYKPTAGWVAASIFALKIEGIQIANGRHEPVPGYAWLQKYRPVTRVGKSILLYHVPAGAWAGKIAPARQP